METKEIGLKKTKEEIAEILSNNGLSCFPTTYRGCEGFFIPVSDLAYPGLFVTMCNKDICIVYPHEILYIAIEDRKSVLYLIDRKVETNYRLDHWKELLDLKTFAQPHHSFIVNLNYVDEVTKEWVKVKYRDKEYQVYTSSRKIGAFKKAFLKFGER